MGDRRTYIRSCTFDLVVAADVLYGGRDRWFTRALDAHVSRSTTAYVAIPPREDSPLAGFFSTLIEQGLDIERLEDTLSTPADVFATGRFNMLSETRCKAIAAVAASEST